MAAARAVAQRRPRAPNRTRCPRAAKTYDATAAAAQDADAKPADGAAAAAAQGAAAEEEKRWWERFSTSTSSTLALAFLCTKALFPVRGAITLGVTPMVARCVPLRAAPRGFGVSSAVWLTRALCPAHHQAGTPPPPCPAHVPAGYCAPSPWRREQHQCFVSSGTLPRSQTPLRSVSPLPALLLLPSLPLLPRRSPSCPQFRCPNSTAHTHVHTPLSGSSAASGACRVAARPRSRRRIMLLPAVGAGRLIACSHCTTQPPPTRWPAR